MTKEEVFARWAPHDSLWSPWAKPVLFAHLEVAMVPIPVSNPAGGISWAPAISDKVALVLDLPGAAGVELALALANRGYRPVPLYNAVPLPFVPRDGEPRIQPDIAAVDVAPILVALRAGAVQLGQIHLPADALPVFLLDANRRGSQRQMLPDQFDNRSISFTTDFPSANFLSAHGIQRILLVQKDRLEPQSDLAHSLRRWQEGGLRLERLRLDLPSMPEPFTVARPSWYGAMFQRVLSSLGFLRAEGGGFGAGVPDSSAGG